MVVVVNKNGREYFECDICAMLFKKRKQAEHCEVRCKNGDKCQGKMIRHCLQL